MSFTHEHSWKLRASPERVMSALTESAQLTRWFAEHANYLADADDEAEAARGSDTA